MYYNILSNICQAFFYNKFHEFYEFFFTAEELRVHGAALTVRITNLCVLHWIRLSKPASSAYSSSSTAAMRLLPKLLKVYKYMHIYLCRAPMITDLGLGYWVRKNFNHELARIVTNNITTEGTRLRQGYAEASRGHGESF